MGIVYWVGRIGVYVMKSRLSCIKNGVELYVPVPENDAEKKELKLREERFANFLGEIILKYYSKVKDDINDK